MAEDSSMSQGRLCGIRDEDGPGAPTTDKLPRTGEPLSNGEGKHVGLKIAACSREVVFVHRRNFRWWLSTGVQDEVVWSRHTTLGELALGDSRELALQLLGARSRGLVGRHDRTQRVRVTLYLATLGKDKGSNPQTRMAKGM